VGDVLSCSAESALSYRWTNLHNDDDEQTYGKTISVSQPGNFNYECSVHVEFGDGVICPFASNISGFARGIRHVRCGREKSTDLSKLGIYRK